MSWGERSCNGDCRCPDKCSIGTCNVGCPEYIWDGVTKPDSENPIIDGQSRRDSISKSFLLKEKTLVYTPKELLKMAKALAIARSKQPTKPTKIKILNHHKPYPRKVSCCGKTFKTHKEKPICNVCGSLVGGKK